MPSRRKTKKLQSGEYKAFGFGYLDSIAKVGRLIRGLNNLGYSSVEVAEFFQEATRSRTIVLDADLHHLMKRVYVKQPHGVPLSSVLASANRQHQEDELFDGTQIEIELHDMPLTAFRARLEGRPNSNFPRVLVPNLGRYPLLKPGNKPYGCPLCGRAFRTFCPRDLHWAKCTHF